MTNSTYAKEISIASIIITYNHVEEAKAQIDIIRELWQPMFKTVDIYHEFNGKKNWYPKKYKESFLHRHRSMDHVTGANHMLNMGIKHVMESGKKYDFYIISSGDTWFYDSKKLKSLILNCYKKRIQLSTSLWAMVALGTEFFVITPDLAKKVFPITITKILKEYNLLKWANKRIAIFESIFTLKVMKVLKNPNKIYLIPGRRAVWPTNRFWSPDFYASHHDRNQRKKDISPKIRHSLGTKIANMPSLYKFIQ